MPQLALQIRQITHPDAQTLHIMTQWMFDWWGKDEGYTEAAVQHYLAHGMQTTRLPQTYGLYLADVQIGMYQFRLDDLFVRPDIYPWLANVYIDPRYRGQGYGRQLMQSIPANAARLPFDELFLFTRHHRFYEKFGWHFVEVIDTHLEACRMQRLYRLNLKQ